MNAYRQELSPSDPVPHRPPCSVEEINYKVLLEAMNLHKSNPVLDCDLDDLETIYMDDDQMELDAMDIEEENVHVKVVNSILSPSHIDAENNQQSVETNVDETTADQEMTGVNPPLNLIASPVGENSDETEMNPPATASSVGEHSDVTV